MRKPASKGSFIVCAVVVGLFLLPLAAAAAEGAGWYFNADGGVAFVQDMQSPQEHATKLDPGPCLSLGAGYNFTEWFGAGVEAGWMSNLAQNRSFYSNERGQGLTLDDYQYRQIPFLANVEFRLPNKSRFIPMIGGGAGAAHRSFYALDNSHVGSTADVTFAWQVYGGVRYRISDRYSLGVVYKYLALPSSMDGTFNIHADSGVPVSFDGSKTHSFSLRFQMDF